MRMWWWAMQLGVWLCGLPLRLRVYSSPALLTRLTRVRRGQESCTALEVERAVRIVTRLCELPVFRLPVFPRRCLRQSLALYYLLNRLGCPVEIHFGVYKTGKALHGHSRVTVEGRPMAESTPVGVLHRIYSYPSISSPTFR